MHSSRLDSRPRRGLRRANSRSRRYLRTLGLLLCLALLAGCATQPPASTPAPSPFPTFDLSDLPTPLAAEESPLDLAPPAVTEYLAAVAPYTTSGIIAAAPDFSTERLDGIVTTLEGLTVPPDMIPAHETLLKGYRTIAQGRHIAVENIGDGAQQAEARSQYDFGRLLLQEHIQIVTAYLAALRSTPVP